MTHVPILKRRAYRYSWYMPKDFPRELRTKVENVEGDLYGMWFEDIRFDALEGSNQLGSDCRDDRRLHIRALGLRKIWYALEPHGR